MLGDRKVTKTSALMEIVDDDDTIMVEREAAKVDVDTSVLSSFVTPERVPRERLAVPSVIVAAVMTPLAEIVLDETEPDVEKFPALSVATESVTVTLVNLRRPLKEPPNKDETPSVKLEPATVPLVLTFPPLITATPSVSVEPCTVPLLEI